MPACTEATKRKYRAAGDQMFLDRMAGGTLRVNTRLAMVWTKRKPEGKWKRMQPRYDSRRKYLFVRCYRDGARKAIALHRLVWIAAHGRLIPDGCEIHHKHGREKNGIAHLELLGTVEHAALTYGYPEEWDGEFDQEEF